MQEQSLVQKSPILSLLHVDRNLSADFEYYNCMGVKKHPLLLLYLFFQFFCLRALFIC